MSRIVVLGGGLVGCSTAMMLARDGHEVTLLERDNAPVPGSPEEAWHMWERSGVAQFRQPHYLHSAGRRILDRHLPGVTEELLRAGCAAFDLTGIMPPHISDRAPRPGDERFVTVTGRRPVVEYVVARAAERLVRVVRGASAAALLTGAPAAKGIPHVAGVRTMDGREFAADLVIDATGRRSKLPEWLRAIGARRPIEETEEFGIIYYTRFFRSTTGGVPAHRSGFRTDYQSFSLLTLPGDSRTWSVTFFVFSGDPVLKALRDSCRWTTVVAACPLHAHWLDGEPITDVIPMGTMADRYRSFVVDGAPVATGVVTVGDACAVTNPIGGRGITVGLMHAVGTAEVVRAHLDDPLTLALAHDAMTETRVTPWYRDTVEFDRKHAARINAAAADRSARRPTDPLSALPVAMMYDPDLFRASIEIFSLLALPQEVIARPGVPDRIMEVAGTREPIVPPGPTREELVRMLA